MTPYRRAEVVKEWREAFYVLSLGSPKLAWADVEVRVYLRDLRDQDPGNAYPSAKAALDGVVDAKVIAGDDSRYVRSIKLYAPELKTFDALGLSLIGEPA